METTTENNLEKADLPTQQDPGVPSSAITDIISQFDETLGKHLDKLLGARQGIEALPINMFTVSCLILLATRDTEIESFPYLPPERYTKETLLDNITEMNIELGGDLESYLKSMLDKGYLQIADDGRLFPGSPTMKMALLFDRIFPKMPGLNLVAYLGQMIDEVLSKRKELKIALSQFDQMLNLHGVSLKKDADSPQKDTTKLFPHLKTSAPVQPAKKKIFATDIKPSDIYSKLQTNTWTAPQFKTETSVSSFDIESREINKVAPQDLSSKEYTSPAAGVQVEVKEQIQEIKAPIGQAMADDHKDISIDQSNDMIGHSTHVSSMDEAESISEYERDFDSDEKSGQPEDDDIEKRIAAFEEQLGLACPLCRTSGIMPRTTAKGKPFYKCSNEGCNFISWGKPYYITCPTCENPFLIEAPDSQGNMMLKCPRATCPHWQKFPWEEDAEPDMKSIEPVQSTDTAKKPRRVVKRRRRVVVRRKS